MNAPLLFTPLAVGPLTLPNRIMISPMCQYSGTNGNANDWHMAHLGSLALSGAGLLFVEATSVSPEGRITAGCLGLYNDENHQSLSILWLVIFLVNSVLNILVIFETCMLQTIFVSYYKSLCLLFCISLNLFDRVIDFKGATLASENSSLWISLGKLENRGDRLPPTFFNGSVQNIFIWIFYLCLRLV